MAGSDDRVRRRSKEQAAETGEAASTEDGEVTGFPAQLLGDAGGGTSTVGPEARRDPGGSEQVDGIVDRPPMADSFVRSTCQITIRVSNSDFPKTDKP